MAEAITDEVQVDLSLHPFDKPGVVAVVARLAPEFVEPLKKASRPTISAHPDELEKWEARQILARKPRWKGETDFDFLLRTLYEETFSVDQNPGSSSPKEFRGSRGLTPGGLISHFYFTGSINRLNAHDVLNNIQGETLKDALTGLGDSKDASGLIDMAGMMTYPIGSGSGEIQNLRSHAWHVWRTQGNWENFTYPQEVDTIGFRLLRILKEVPELTQLERDEKLFGQRVRRLTIAEEVVSLWHHFSGEKSTIFNLDAGTYKHETDGPEVTSGLRQLLFIRTHPEMQVIYRYLSPSGYLNEKKFT